MVGKNFQIYDVQVTEKTFASQKLKVDIFTHILSKHTPRFFYLRSLEAGKNYQPNM